MEGETEAKEVMVEGLAMEGGKHTENNADEELELEALNRESGLSVQCPPTPVRKRVRRDKQAVEGRVLQYRIEAEIDKKMDEMEERKKKWKVIGMTGPGTCTINVEGKAGVKLRGTTGTREDSPHPQTKDEVAGGNEGN